MTKCNQEEKLLAIIEVENGGSIYQVAKLHQISKSELQMWIRNYQQNGENGLKTHAYGCTSKQKYEVLKYMHDNQISFKETGVVLGIRPSTIWQWEKRYLENGIEGLEDKKKGRKPRVQKPKPPMTREEELLDRIQYLEAENAYLKKLNALVGEREKREKGIR
ncbi:hypothetical protein ADM99_01065 [Leptolinea tardivitalis]|uniref:Insertion element IS150 protein InsJ-like helix-turn-helix domain-containing protein n=2 Tax=Leptolinea tardivitalis TaxID=229920 RepID=A0A0P6XID3_9CHLR|nr:hypothetical protein ADM99_01065 [Leptolinea tardivitalis]GAP22934.1 protein containing helix-turn-helix domain [Leptolinea tardivitalis]